MRRTLFGIFGLLLIHGAICYGEPAATKVSPPTTADAADNPPQAHFPAPTPVWTDELIEIRRQLGGGALKGSLLEPPPPVGEASREFVRELQRISNQHPPPKFSPAISPDFHTSPGETKANRPDGELIDTLRRAAQRLDDKANRLEFAAEYTNADRLRKLAKRLRGEARALAVADE